jgi:hypothetical protein
MGLAVSAREAFAFANSVSYRGQGLLGDGFGGYDLVTEICAVLDENGNIIPDALGSTADAVGPYLLWVLTATGANNADITFDANVKNADGNVVGLVMYPMAKTGNGTFKYISGWYDPTTLPSNVSATYDGKAKNAQLVISHGCRPFNKGAWCSPGFWGRAEDGAWDLIGYSRTELFNSTIYDSIYGATFPVDPTLNTVLTATGGTYKGPGVAGTDPRTDPTQGGIALNAFNATGAFLTDHIPGYTYDPAALSEDESDTCPIDHHGNFKE